MIYWPTTSSSWQPPSSRPSPCRSRTSSGSVSSGWNPRSRSAADLSRPIRILFALALGFGIGGALQFVSSVTAGIAFVTMFATSVFAGLLLFEFVTERDLI